MDISPERVRELNLIAFFKQWHWCISPWRYSFPQRVNLHHANLMRQWGESGVKIANGRQ